MEHVTSPEPVPVELHEGLPQNAKILRINPGTGEIVEPSPDPSTEDVADAGTEMGDNGYGSGEASDGKSEPKVERQPEQSGDVFALKALGGIALGDFLGARPLTGTHRAGWGGLGLPERILVQPDRTSRAEEIVPKVEEVVLTPEEKRMAATTVMEKARAVLDSKYIKSEEDEETLKKLGTLLDKLKAPQELDEEAGRYVSDIDKIRTAVRRLEEKHRREGKGAPTPGDLLDYYTSLGKKARHEGNEQRTAHIARRRELAGRLMGGFYLLPRENIEVFDVSTAPSKTV